MQPGGDEVVAACVKSLQDREEGQQQQQPVLVELKVTAQKITVGIPGEEKPLEAIQIKHVSYTGADANNRKIFAFIANDPKSGTMACHVFLCKVKAKVVSDAVKAAFETAQQQRCARVPASWVAAGCGLNSALVGSISPPRSSVGAGWTRSAFRGLGPTPRTR